MSHNERKRRVWHSRMTTCAILMLAVASVSVLVGGCHRNQPERDQLTSVVVAQWGQEKYLIYLPFYVALEKGFFKQQGLDVSIRFSGNDDQVFATVMQGSAQFGIGDPTFTAIANEKNPGVGRVVASIVDGVAIWGVAKRGDIKTIQKSADLGGLRVGTFPSPSTNYTLMKEAIASGGEALKDTTIVQAPIGGQIALLEKDLADIAMVLEPAASKAEAEGYHVVLSSPSFHGPFAFTGLTTVGSYCRDHDDVVQKMVAGIQEALRYCHTDVEGTIALARTLFPDLDGDVVARAVRRMLAERTIPQSALVSRPSWEAALHVRLAVGDLKVQQEYTASVDPTFAEKAIPQYP
jgi:NitT/TauT family transport system substrate-binding protein